MIRKTCLLEEETKKKEKTTNLAPFVEIRPARDLLVCTKLGRMVDEPGRKAQSGRSNVSKDEMGRRRKTDDQGEPERDGVEKSFGDGDGFGGHGDGRDERIGGREGRDEDEN